MHNARIYKAVKNLFSLFEFCFKVYVFNFKPLIYVFKTFNCFLKIIVDFFQFRLLYIFLPMFISTKEDLKSGDYVTVLGKVSKFESPLLYIQTKTAEIPIQYKTIHPYSTEYVCVSGTVSNNKIVIEESVEPLNSNFDVNNFDDFVKAAKRFPDIF